MEKINTDARKAAEEKWKSELKLEIEHIFDSGANEARIQNMVELFIEKRFAKSRPTILDDLGIDTAAGAWVEKHVVFAKWEDAFKAGYAFRESLSEQCAATEKGFPFDEPNAFNPSNT